MIKIILLSRNLVRRNEFIIYTKQLYDDDPYSYNEDMFAGYVRIGIDDYYLQLNEGVLLSFKELSYIKICIGRLQMNPDLKEESYEY